MMNNRPTSLSFCNTTIFLLPERAVFLQDFQALLLSDTHFGKIQHFVANGLPLPSINEYNNLSILQELILTYNPTYIYILGDLFHSDWNESYDELGMFIQTFPDVAFHLVKGNHDVLSDHLYQKLGFEVYQDSVDIGPFQLKHQVEQVGCSNNPTISGHIHPAAILKGSGKQFLRLPCFWIKGQDLVLPAFGYYTGTHPIACDDQDIVHVIAEASVLRIQ
jgi:DNA ligase-associated metallophosphoesterase